MLTQALLIPWRASAAILVALLTALVLAACGSSAVPVPSGHPLLSIVQDNALVGGDPSATLPALRALGVDVVRVDVPWAAVAPDASSAREPSFDALDPNAYPSGQWATFDAIDRDAAAVHMRVDFMLTSPVPLWATAPGAPSSCAKPCEHWKPSAALFGQFVRAIGERYSGHFTPPGSTTPLPRVSFWSIWNEPNYGPDLAPQAIDGSKVEVSPRLYRGLLGAAWSALEATGHTPATDTILIGETAPRGQTGPHLPGALGGMVPLRFIRALYCVNSAFRPLRGQQATLRGCPDTAAGSHRFATENPALFRASGWSDHPYPDNFPPTTPTPVPVGGGYADFAVLSHLGHTLDEAAAAYGRHPHLPIYSTEFGYMTRPPLPVGTSLVHAAAWLNESEYLSWLNPRIRSYDQYLLRDPGPLSGSNFDTGLEFDTGRPKPYVYDAYRMPLWLPRTTGTDGSPLVVWGCVRPAPVVAQATHRPQHVVVQLAPKGSDAFRTARSIRLDTKRGCYFASRVVFQHGGTVRLAWSGSGPTLYSRTQAITLR